ncbi:facilitated trehalose transporter Tret1-like [Macrosteles quadrilineatus]|uniref:facilitated trehalose transporter Tret1-like n=1 Tax=Macrosteles quadrilineatus TaxID=74068 RepID=UPI0023E30AE5|nr:facilitated trehalose transporter Tret1-like [Macrosteles quadrilineatus]
MTTTEMEVQESGGTFRSTCAQVLGATAFGFVIMGVGLIFGMPTIVIGELAKPNATMIHGVELDEYSASWFGSIIFISQPVGSLVSGFLQDMFGRKRCMLVVNIPQLIGWLMLYSATSVPWLYAAVTVMGLSVGFMEAPVLSYIGEITEPRLRGVLCSIAGMYLNIGIMLECYIGALTHWRTMALISALGPALCFLILSQVPESPAWLVYKGRIAEAERALCWLRGWVDPSHVSKELSSLVAHLDRRKVTIVKASQPNYHQVPSQDVGDKKQKNKSEAMQNLHHFLQPATQRPLKLILIYFFCSHCASLIGIRPFLVQIFDKLQMPIDSKWVVVVVGTLQVLGALGCMLVMKLLGKRGLSFLSMSICVVCAVSISAYVVLQYFEPWVPMVLFCLLFFAAQLGIGSIPWMLISEVFPIEGRGIAGGVSAACGYSFIFVVTKSYIYLEHWFNIWGALLVYAVIGLWGIAYLYYCLPETEGKTLAEIEPYFMTKKERMEKTPSLKNVSVPA